jgi:hypothetical protein
VFKSPGVVSVIKVLRLEWIHFVAKINNGRTVKKLPEGKPGEGSKQGRPRLRWLDDVELDLITVGVRIWKIGTVNGTEWASVVTDAKDELKGL